MMTSDQGMISYEEFAGHEFAMIQDILEARAKINREMREAIEREQKSQGQKVRRK